MVFITIKSTIQVCAKDHYLSVLPVSVWSKLIIFPLSFSTPGLSRRDITLPQCITKLLKDNFNVALAFSKSLHKTLLSGENV